MAERVLIVEDEDSIAALVEHHLRQAGFVTVRAAAGRAAVDAFMTTGADLIILDVMLPDMDGLAVCREVRRTSDVPVIFLTARREEIDRVVGLELGADDYITKPFSPRELVARVKAVLRRTGGPRLPERAGAMVRGAVRIDPLRRTVSVAGQPVSLTTLEFDLLLALAERPGLVLTRDQLLDRVWGIDFAGDPRTVDVHIHHLREKIEPDSQTPRYLQTVRGVGYRFLTEP